MAFALTVLPLPAWAQAWRPAWVALVLLYWCMALPERIGVFTAWFTGVLLDVLVGATLGQHALGLAVVACLTVIYHKRLRVFSQFQQATICAGMLLLYVSLLRIVDRFAGMPQPSASYLTVITSALLWPWLFIILRDVRRKGSVR
jgi:rod shape-determining protein MreD